jgi:hypothetical protein
MCIGCMPTEKERQELIEKKSNEAKAHAVAEKKIYILYNLADGQINFMSADAARAADITAIKYISYL